MEARHRKATRAWDVDEFTQVYDDTSACVYGVVLQLVVDPAQAAEVTEEVYLELWRGGAAGGSVPCSTVAGLVARAHRLAVDRRRSRGASDTPAEALQDNEALSDLPTMQRRTIELTFFRGRSLPEVVRALGIPLETVAHEIRRGLVQLRPDRDRAESR